MGIDLCCFGNSLAKNFDLRWRISEDYVSALKRTLRSPWVVCNVTDWRECVKRIQRM
jgi:hypothetical protein